MRPTTPDARHAAGHGQPVRRHGRPAGHAPVRPGRGHRLDRHHRADLDDHAPRRRRDRADRRVDGHHHRHGDRRAAASSAASRSRSTAARPGIGPPAARTGPTPGRRRRSAQRRSRAARSTTAATSSAPAGVTVTVERANVPVQHLGRRQPRRRSPLRHDTRPVELGVKFRADVGRLHHRRAVLQGRGQHRHPRRQPVDGRPARCWPPPPSPARRPPAGSRSIFADPGAVSANTTYVASYHAPNGGYAADSATSHGRRLRQRRRCTRWLTARRPTASTATARERRSRPTATSASNYWVDVVFTTTAPTSRRHRPSTSTAPAPSATKASPATTVTATFSEAVRRRIGRRSRCATPGGATVAGRVGYDAPAAPPR